MLEIPSDIEWLEPWIPDSDKDEEGAKELSREVCDQHILFGVTVRIVGMRTDTDDFLFVTNDPEKLIVVVHLTWKFESDPNWPHTRIFSDWQDWIENCLKVDHNDYIRNG